MAVKLHTAVKPKSAIKLKFNKYISICKVYSNCSYEAGVLSVGSLLIEFRNLVGRRSFKLHSHDKVAHHSGEVSVYFDIFCCL